MTNITSYQDTFFQQIESSTVANPKLAAQVDPNGLVIVSTAPILTSDSVAPIQHLVLTINNPDGSELVHVKAGQVSADGLTITLTNVNQRNIKRAADSSGGIDFDNGDGGVISHPQFTEIRVSIDPLTWTAQNQVIRGILPSGGTQWLVGKGVDENIEWVAQTAAANKPRMRFDPALGTGLKWQFSENGTSFTSIAGGVNPTGGDGISITSGVVAVDTTDTTKFVSASSGAGDSGKVAVLDANGDILDGFIPATIARDSELSGITPVQGTNLTDGSNADALHIHSAAKKGAITSGVVTVTNTTTETNLLSFSLTGGELSTNNAVKVWLPIDQLKTHGSAGTLTLRAKYGATTLVTFTLPGNASRTYDGGYLEFILTANGSANSQHGVLTIRTDQANLDSSAVLNTPPISQTTTGSSAIASASAQTLSITAQWQIATINGNISISDPIATIIK